MERKSDDLDHISIPPGKIAQSLFRYSVGDEKVLSLKEGRSLRINIYSMKLSSRFKTWLVYNEENEPVGIVVKRTA